MQSNNLDHQALDLAAVFFLKQWSIKRQSIYFWIALVSSAILIIVFLRFQLAAPTFCVATIDLGLMALFSVVRAEAKGEYATRGGRYIKRDERPERFRGESNMLVVTGICLIAIGAFVGIYGSH